jgi:tRNA nucleotidyltransferase (CCA-adding enzyme)
MAIVLRHDKINVNTLYAQLRKTARSISSEYEEVEFEVFRSTFWTNEADTSAILLEFEVWQLPELVHHLGPPLNHDPANQERFMQKYKDDRPYAKDGRWVVDTRRKYRFVSDLLSEILVERRGFGKNLKNCRDIQAFEDEGILKINDLGWHSFLNEYLF